MTGLFFGRNFPYGIPASPAKHTNRIDNQERKPPVGPASAGRSGWGLSDSGIAPPNFHGAIRTVPDHPKVTLRLPGVYSSDFAIRSPDQVRHRIIRPRSARDPAPVFRIRTFRAEPFGNGAAGDRPARTGWVRHLRLLSGGCRDRAALLPARRQAVPRCDLGRSAQLAAASGGAGVDLPVVSGARPGAVAPAGRRFVLRGGLAVSDAAPLDGAVLHRLHRHRAGQCGGGRYAVHPFRICSASC
ncbi:hypothetical protein QE379_002815 [Sphingomonas sp. SORGH_AS 879]|nr:hypothetical protein [Sphingomonas sp. SORGH_AS_0879]